MGNSNTKVPIYVFCKYQNNWTRIQKWEYIVEIAKISDLVHMSYGHNDMLALMIPVISKFCDNFPKKNTPTPKHGIFYNRYTDTGVHVLATMLPDKDNVATVKLELPCHDPSTFEFVVTTDLKFNDKSVSIRETNILVNKETDWNLTRDYRKEFRDIVWDCCKRTTAQSTINSLILEVVDKMETSMQHEGVLCHHILTYLHSKFKDNKQPNMTIQDMMDTLAGTSDDASDESRKKQKLEMDNKRNLICAQFYSESDAGFVKKRALWFDKMIMDPVWIQTIRGIKTPPQDTSVWRECLNDILQNLTREIVGYTSQYKSLYPQDDPTNYRRSHRDIVVYNSGLAYMGRDEKATEKARRQQDAEDLQYARDEQRRNNLPGCIVVNMTHKNMMPIIAALGILVVSFDIDTSNITKIPLKLNIHTDETRK